MAVEIGPIIKKVAESKGFTKKMLAEQIPRHEKTVANIYKRLTIDTNLLLKISQVLNEDFFKYFYEEEPLKSFRENEIKEFQQRIDQLKNELNQKETIISTQVKYVESQEDVIRLMKEKENFFRSNPSG